jgi:hypothetical protein
MAKRRRFMVSGFLATTVIFTLLIGANPAQSSSPPRRQGTEGPSHPRGIRSGQATVNAVVVKSWGNCNGGSLIWDSLNLNWANYGSISISINYSYPGLCGVSDDVTLAELEASGADVVIVSDPSGGSAQWSSADAQALQQYALQGHNVIGTYLLLQYDVNDNRVLAPLFGLRPAIDYTGGDVSITPTYVERYPGLPLFRDVGNPYVSSGFNYTQTPVDGVWSANELAGARLVARTSDPRAAILVLRRSAYYGIYITNMPEYVGSTIDEQFFYNAIIFPATGS